MGKTERKVNINSQSIQQSFVAMMYSAALLVVVLATINASSPTIKNPDEKSIDALENVINMELELYGFYKNWDQLVYLMTKQNVEKAAEKCEKTYRETCEPKSRNLLKRCIDHEAGVIHITVIQLYKDNIETPWAKEFELLRIILKNPEKQSEAVLNEAIRAVQLNSTDRGSVAYRFYSDLVNFQLPNIAPELQPLDKLHELCLKSVFSADSDPRS